VGILENELPHMFERFHRVQNIAGRTYEGTGIGLSLIREMIQLHGGNISVESTQVKRSKFIVAIPSGKDHLPSSKIAVDKTDLKEITAEIYIEEAESLLTTGLRSIQMVMEEKWQ